VLARRREGAQMYYRVDNEQVRELCLTLLGSMPAQPQALKRRRSAAATANQKLKETV
jgi:hypothetical protein